ncbi:rhodanese-like domain-containing protein [Prosthecobacter dejongeii]|uniref:Rhodanese domain-containing protein n=1 Tax=Prosthecobacter dejongeii TaxID=48465 RepID=A0A7W8DR74_9BACT|nr:rhodanese-like domain-containing protein [Prosthecobacter dejongeii]MBB5038975.1 hypothetical protein [Prosthecobacter dejongeii]
MKAHLIFFSCLLGLTMTQAENPVIGQKIPNRLISYEGFEKNVHEVAKIRESRRLTEAQFLQKMSEPGVILLDARSASKFQLRHIHGAVNLSLPDFHEAALAKIIPAKNTVVLIYCNNNFENSPVSFTDKSISTALNLHTFVSLQGYGYTNVFELGPLLDVHTTRLPFAGAEVKEKSSR